MELEKVFAVWTYEYDDGGVVGVFSTQERAEAKAHALAKQYNGSAEDESERMTVGQTDSGLLAYSDKYWNHRVGISVYAIDAEASE